MFVALWATLTLFAGPGTVQGEAPDSPAEARIENAYPSTGLPVSGGRTDGAKTRLMSSPTPNQGTGQDADSSPSIQRSRDKVAPPNRDRVIPNSRSPGGRDAEPDAPIVADSSRPQTVDNKVARPDDNQTMSSGTTRPDTFRNADTLPLAPRWKERVFSADRDTPPTATGGIRGTVKDRNDRDGIAGATIAVDGTSLSATAGNDGGYLIRAVPAGRRRLTASAEGYVSADTTVVVSPGRSLTVDFRLRPTGGHFRGAPGRRHDQWDDWAWWHEPGTMREPAPLEWIQTFPGRWVAVGYSVTGSRDNGFLAAGITMVPQGSGQLYLVKTSDEGSLDWETYITIDSLTGISAVETTFSGGYVVLGTSRLGAWVVETDPRGKRILKERFDAWPTGSAAQAIRVRDGGYLVWEQGGRLAKYRADAYPEWVFAIPQAGPEDDGPDEDRLSALPDKGWLIHDRNLHYVRLDSLWRLQWSRDFSAIDSAVALSLGQTADSGFVAAGFIQSYLPGRQEDMYLVKTDRFGFRQWERIYGDSGIDQANCVLPVSDRGLVIAGDAGGTAISSGFGQIMKTDSLGYDQWTIQLKDPSTARSVRETSDGGLIVVGTTYQSGLPSMYLLKLDPAHGGEYDRRW